MMTQATESLGWLLDDLISRVPSARQAIVLSVDGLLMAASTGTLAMKRTDGSSLDAARTRRKPPWNTVSVTFASPRERIAGRGAAAPVETLRSASPPRRAAGCSARCSGRIASVTLPAAAASRGSSSRPSEVSTAQIASAAAATVPASSVLSPMKPAAKRVAGRV